jgi:L-fuconolactonase
MNSIDAHHHFWRVARGDYGWLENNPAVAEINRDFLPADLEAARKACGVSHTVLVQAAPTVAETDFLLNLAEQTPHIAKVVGWIDFENAASRRELDRLATHEAFAGVRPMIQNIADPEWMNSPGVQWAYAALLEHDLAFDALGKPVHLEHFQRLFDTYPDLRIVIDHAMKPAILNRDDGRNFDYWAEHMAGIAESTPVCCKVSGLLTEAAPGDGVEVLRPYVEHLLAAFGAKRLMWGSDWPVVNLASDYISWHSMAKELIPETDHAAVFGETAQRFYRIQA